MRIDSQNLSPCQTGSHIVHCVVFLPAVNQRRFLHLGKCLDLLPNLFCNDRNLARDLRIGWLNLVVSLIKLNLNCVIPCPDDVLLDLLIGAFDSGHDGDDGGDSNDDSQHRQERTHFVSPYSLE